MNPSDTVKMRYVAERSTYPESTNTSGNKYWLGYETSIATLGEFGYLGTNDGFLQCINLNTMSLVWAQDVQDDTNGSPVLETDFANRTAYVYIGSSLHFTADSDMKGSVSFYKVNAITVRDRLEAHRKRQHKGSCLGRGAGDGDPWAEEHLRSGDRAVLPHAERGRRRTARAEQGGWFRALDVPDGEIHLELSRRGL